jgi:osmotically-inducible protein OsmY
VSPVDVDVSIDLGAATLEGEVETWAERRAAVRAALSGGVKQVINKVTVTAQG